MIHDDLEDEFPLGDGTAAVAETVWCPRCGASVEIQLDPGGGAIQDYVEDCAVCCRPWQVRVRYRTDGGADVHVVALDE